VTRLVYIHNIAMPGPEANTVNVAKMCAAFASNGASVTLAALPGAPGPPRTLRQRICEHYEVPDSFDVAPLPAAAARPTMAAIVGAAIARRRQADITYTRAPHVALAACLTGSPTVLELHNPPTAFSALGRSFFRQTLAHPNLIAVVAISQALATRMQTEHPNARIIVAHDGADPRPPGPSQQNNVLRVGFVGRFYRGKGVELVTQLARLCPWAEFHLVGGDLESAARLVGRALPGNIKAHGAVTHAQAGALLDTFDVALAPYQRSVMVADGKTDTAAWMSPLKLFEYMAAGKAIIASDLPVLHEILRHEDNALLAPPDDAPAWEAALTALSGDAVLRKRLGARAHATFLQHHTWRARARHILDALHQTTAPRTM
jgi:glycosyltransferase involved in cell wall biosynthesis